MNYEQAKNIKKQWTSIHENNIKLIVKQHKEICLRVPDKVQELEIKLQDYENIKLITGLFDDEGGQSETTTITIKHGNINYNYIINQDDDLDKEVDDIKRCLATEKIKQKYTNTLIKMYSYGHNQDLANLVKYYNQLKELSHNYLEVLGENVDLLKGVWVGVPDGQVAPETKKEGTYNDAAKTMKLRLDDGEGLIKTLDELLIAKEILEAKKKSKKRKGRK